MHHLKIIQYWCVIPTNYMLNQSFRYCYVLNAFVSLLLGMKCQHIKVGSWGRDNVIVTGWTLCHQARMKFIKVVWSGALPADVRHLRLSWHIRCKLASAKCWTIWKGCGINRREIGLTLISVLLYRLLTAKLYTKVWNTDTGLLKGKAWYLWNYMYFTNLCTFKGIFVNINNSQKCLKLIVTTGKGP